MRIGGKGLLQRDENAVQIGSNGCHGRVQPVLDCVRPIYIYLNLIVHGPTHYWTARPSPSPEKLQKRVLTPFLTPFLTPDTFSDTFSASAPPAIAPPIRDR